MDSTTIVVTGGTRGIGQAIVAGLGRAAPNARVIFTARDAARANALGGEHVVGDLATLAGTRAVAEALRARVDRIDVLVHNAGVWPTALNIGPDGYEESFVTNHLSPHLLNRMLADRIADGGRIVQVTSGMYPRGHVDLDKTPRGADFKRFGTYANTKAANALMTRRWASVLAGKVDVNAVHPGVIRTNLGATGGLTGILLRLVKRFWHTPEEGARGPIRLALDPALHRTTDRFYNELVEAPWQAPATDPALIAAVWEHAERAVT